MKKIISFLINNKNVLLFIVLFMLSIALTVQSHTYHRNKFINSSNVLIGTFYTLKRGVTEHFSLKKQKKLLIDENKRLRFLLHNSVVPQTTFTDSLTCKKQYQFYTANVIKNSYGLRNNILTLNRGLSDSIKRDFGVISTNGIVGIVDNISNHYCTVLSVLSKSMKVSVKLKKSNHFGTLTWNGKSYKELQLIDIPVVASVKKGDTITTSGRSLIFPKGIFVGVIQSYTIDNSKNYYNINVRLFNDLKHVENVYIIENKDAEEINELLKL